MARRSRRGAAYAKRESVSEYRDETRYTGVAGYDEGHSRRRGVSDERYSRDDAADRYVSDKIRSRRRLRSIRNVLIAVLIAVGVGLLGAWGIIAVLNSNLQQGVDSDLRNVLVRTNLTAEPFYMVLLGTDESIGRHDDNSTEDTYRTDTIMLARVDAPNKKVTLVSMQRDTMVDLGEHGKQKLNAAYALGGAAMAVQTVGDIAHVGISHFALVDMDGLREVVDALGGIEVNVPITIDDEDAGGHLDAGMQVLNGEQALILCRSRNAFEAYGSGDVYRAANQRVVLQAIASKILASDAATIANTVRALSQAVQTDLSVNEIIGLAQAFQGMDSSRDLYTASMPTESMIVDEIWYDIIVEDKWREMMNRVRAGMPPTAENDIDKLTGAIMANAGGEVPANEMQANVVRKASVVSVRNGSGVEGAAESVQRRLEAVGYTVADTGNADTFDYPETLVVFNNPELAPEALEIAQALGGATPVLNDNTYIINKDFLIVIGASYQ